MSSLGKRLYVINIGNPKIAGEDAIRHALEAAKFVNNKFSLCFLETEWEQIVDVWRLKTWVAYRDVRQLSRCTRLTEAQRQVLWVIFEQVRKNLKAKGLITQSELFNRLAEHFAHSTRPYNFVFVDEARLLQAAGGTPGVIPAPGRISDQLGAARFLCACAVSEPAAWTGTGRSRSRC